MGVVARQRRGVPLRENATAEQHYCAANKRRGDLKLPGEQVSPKIAGSNKYRFLTERSVLYSAKASDAENKVFAAMTGGLLNYEAVRRDREFEDLIQNRVSLVASHAR